jgi:hypothetical protein
MWYSLRMVHDTAYRMSRGTACGWYMIQPTEWRDTAYRMARGTACGWFMLQPTEWHVVQPVDGT